MKIFSVNPYKLNFCSNNHKYEDYQDETELRNFVEDDGFDGHDRSIRDAIRAHMYAQFLPNYGIDERKVSSYARTIDDVYIPNLKKIGNGSYRGSTLAKNLSLVELLPRSGVRTLIDLVGYNKLEHACKEHKIQYVKYGIEPDYWAHPIFKKDVTLIEDYKCKQIKYPMTKEEKEKDLATYKEMVNLDRREFMDEFIKLIHTMKNGHFYISCEHGEYRTPNILALNSYFNPNWTGEITKPTSEFMYKSMKNMYLNMTETEKSRLGFTKEHEAYLQQEFDL